MEFKFALRMFRRHQFGVVLALILSPGSVGSSVFAQCGSLPGDPNNNQHVELTDYASLVSCLAGPDQSPQPPPPQTLSTCLAHFDSNANMGVDLLDFADFQTTYTGSIRPECFNIIFVSSIDFPATLGSAQAYDAQCNALATAAGLNNPQGTGFVAWISTASSLARNRLGTARGFVRPDGVAVADTQSGLLVGNAIFNPIRVDENGNDVGIRFVRTGTEPDGTLSPYTCNDWTNSSSGFQQLGTSGGGPRRWTRDAVALCWGEFPIYCVQKTVTRALVPPRSPGKVIYMSNGLFSPNSGGLASADLLCEQDKPLGAGTVRALLATTTSSAASRLPSSATYVRVDGQMVATSVEFSMGVPFKSGIWQMGNGAYSGHQTVWTGSADPVLIGTTSSTCSNWTAFAPLYGNSGLPLTTVIPNWWDITTVRCTTPQRIYCFEE